MATLVWALLYSVLSSMFNGETGPDIAGKESVICNLLHLDRKNNTEDKQFFPLFSEVNDK